MQKRFLGKSIILNIYCILWLPSAN
jgi:hypothetical protein